MDVSRKFDGRKFMWDGVDYKGDAEAGNALETYRGSGYEAIQIQEGGAFYVFTRKVVTEIKLEEKA